MSVIWVESLEKFKKCADLHSPKGSGKKEGVNFDAALPFPAELEK